MLFMHGSGLSDIIDQTDPCTLNPNDPICVAVGPQIDPCTVNPNQSFCQQGVIKQTILTPDPGSNDSKWSQYVSPSTSQPNWLDKLIANFKNFHVGATPTLNPTGAATSPLATAIGKIPWIPIFGILTVAGGVYGYQRWKKRKS